MACQASKVLGCTLCVFLLLPALRMLLNGMNAASKRLLLPALTSLDWVSSQLTMHSTGRSVHEPISWKLNSNKKIDGGTVAFKPASSLWLPCSSVCTLQHGSLPCCRARCHVTRQRSRNWLSQPWPFSCLTGALSVPCPVKGPLFQWSLAKRLGGSLAVVFILQSVGPGFYVVWCVFL